MLTYIASILFAGALFGPVDSDSTEGVHYRVFRGDGTKAFLEDIINASDGIDIVFVGESHDDPIAHYLEAKILESLHQAYGESRPVALSMEMFERDVQYVVDEYLGDLISEDQFRKSARAWPNYETDYKPSVEYAKENGLDVVAANAPRRYVNRVSRHGRASLDDLPSYVESMLPPCRMGAPRISTGGTGSRQWRRRWKR